jgi:hypothetical protein
MHDYQIISIFVSSQKNALWLSEGLCLELYEMPIYHTYKHIFAKLTNNIYNTAQTQMAFSYFINIHHEKVKGHEGP